MATLAMVIGALLESATTAAKPKSVASKSASARAKPATAPAETPSCAVLTDAPAQDKVAKLATLLETLASQEEKAAKKPA